MNVYCTLSIMSKDHGIVDPLPPQRRVVTGHDANGRSLHASDTSFTPQVIVTPVRTVGMQVLWTVDGIPCRTNSQPDLVDPASVKVTDLSSENGVVVRCVDFAPGGKAVRNLSRAARMVSLIAIDDAPNIINRLCHLRAWRNTAVRA